MSRHLFRLAAAFLNGYRATTTDPDRLGLPKPLPTQRPASPIPVQRPPADRLHRVELLAALRGTSEDAIDDWREWNSEAESAPYVAELVERMEQHEREGRGW